MTDITAVITGHREGLWGGPAMASALEAIAEAEKAGLTVETVIVLDKPDALTQALFEPYVDRGCKLVLTSGGDPGLTRNCGVANAQGKYVSFLDADDMWSFNWLVEAYRFCEDSEGPVVAHSELNVVFGSGRQLWFHADSEAEDFNVYYQRIANYWDAMSFARREIFSDIPFEKNELSAGYGHEDWHWNNLTIEKGIAHRPVPGTVHFKRRRVGSQMSLVDKSDAFVRPSPILDYAWTPPANMSDRTTRPANPPAATAPAQQIHQTAPKRASALHKPKPRKSGAAVPE